MKELSRRIDPEAFETSTTIYCDNQGATELATTAGYRPRSKHIDVRHYFVKERIERREIAVKYIPTEEMAADLLTKGLFCPKLLQI